MFWSYVPAGSEDAVPAWFWSDVEVDPESSRDFANALDGAATLIADAQGRLDDAGRAELLDFQGQSRHVFARDVEATFDGAEQLQRDLKVAARRVRERLDDGQSEQSVRDDRRDQARRGDLARMREARRGWER